MVVLVVLLGICLLTVGWIAWRRPVIFKLGVRNIPRRKAQTVLTIAGLMLSTLIISAAFGTGDTLNYSLTSDVYTNLGHVDELVVSSQGVEAKNVGTGAAIPASAYDTVAQAAAGNANVDGVMPLLDVHVPASNEASRQIEPDVVLVGLDPAHLDQFGGLQSTSGDAIDLASLPESNIVLSAKAADDLDANVGDTVQLYIQNQPHDFTVSAIAPDSYLTGVRRDLENGTELPGMVMALDRLQALSGQSDQITSVAISNTGGVRDSIEPTDAVISSLAPALGGQQLGINPIKQTQVDAATGSAQIFTGLFLVFGLFSIAAGVLLIVLIFSMLAAERRAEMGMTRAIGAQRNQLMQQFVSEGLIYALLSGLVGVTLGVLAAAGIAIGIRPLVGDIATISWHVTPTSVIVSYCLGVGITFLSVVIASWRISRLNIVSAIRDIPDVTTLRRKTRSIVFGVLLLVAGAGMVVLGTSSGSAFPFRLGLSLLPFGVAMLLRYVGVSSRAVFSGVGIYLLVIWLLPSSVFDTIFGKYEGDFEMFFLSGVFLVTGSTMLIIQNTDVLLRGMNALGGLLRGKLASVKTAIAYPGASPMRTGMTVAMFCLIVFALVMTATMSTNFSSLFASSQAKAGWDIRTDATTTNATGDITSALNAQGIDTSDFKAVGVTTSPSNGPSQLRESGTGDWKSFRVEGMNDAFISDTDFLFQQYAAGYESDDAVLNALRTEPDVAIIDASALPAGGPPIGGVSDFQLKGITSDSEGFDPIVIDLAVPGSDQPHQVKIIAVIDSTVTSLSGLYMNQPTLDAIYPSTASSSSWIALSDSGNATEVAKTIESTLSTNGVQAVSIQDEIDEGRGQVMSFFYIIQGFMGLGLLVGVAAIGVIAFRSVVERRQQIGVMRAIGFQRNEISLSFLIETIFIVGLGVISGTTLGLILARNLFMGDELDAPDDLNFIIPWSTVTVILIATVIAALLMTWIPARQASRIAPAEALRYE
jgi:putative ABC transport system permease protein